MYIHMYMYMYIHIYIYMFFYVCVCGFVFVYPVLGFWHRLMVSPRHLTVSRRPGSQKCWWGGASTIPRGPSM